MKCCWLSIVVRVNINSWYQLIPPGIRLSFIGCLLISRISNESMQVKFNVFHLTKCFWCYQWPENIRSLLLMYKEDNFLNDGVLNLYFLEDDRYKFTRIKYLLSYHRLFTVFLCITTNTIYCDGILNWISILSSTHFVLLHAH